MVYFESKYNIRLNSSSYRFTYYKDHFFSPQHTAHKQQFLQVFAFASFFESSHYHFERSLRTYYHFSRCPLCLTSSPPLFSSSLLPVAQSLLLLVQLRSGAQTCVMKIARRTPVASGGVTPPATVANRLIALTSSQTTHLIKNQRFVTILPLSTEKRAIG